MKLNLAFCAKRQQDADREDSHEKLSEHFASRQESVGFELLKSSQGLIIDEDCCCRVLRFPHFDFSSTISLSSSS